MDNALTKGVNDPFAKMFQPPATLIEPQHFQRIAPAREVGRELGVGPRKYNESRNNISRPTDPDIKPWLHMPQVPL